MKKVSRKTAAFLIIIAGVMAVNTTKFVIQTVRRNGALRTFAKTKGSDNAPIKVVEFIDFQCPACAHGAAYLKGKIDKYPEAIRLEVKHYPLQMHRHGYQSSRYVECAARQEKFWPFQDLLLARQSNWQRLVDATPAFEKIAEESHLDKQKLKACLDRDVVDGIIKQNKEEGTALGLRSTPTYFVNGEMVVGSKSLEEKIEKLLKDNGY
ncbi:MAG: thioredoxin domain-containing protein [Candidatus Omnitrophica bacterium]|nr:thioredoxin domain-containing protein [Candidatus Omnitrophota bacterium]